MEKNYITVSREYMERKIDNISDGIEYFRKLKQDLKSIAYLIDFTEDDVNLLEKVSKLSIEKLEALEDILEDDNNEFYRDDEIEI